MNLKIYQKTKYNNIYKHRKNGSYAVDLSLGYDSSGKRIRTTRTGLKSEKEARDLYRNLEESKNIKQSITCNSTFDEGLEEYFEYCENQLRLKSATIRNKKGRFKVNITPHFKDKKIAKIIDKDIVEWHNWLDTKKLDPESKNTLHKQLSAYFNWLINYKKLITVNPCKLVKNYKIPKKEIEYYTIDEINKIFDVIEKDNTKSEQVKLLMTSILKLFFFGGYRVGELFGLKFKDVKADILHSLEFKDEVAIDIAQTVYYTKGGWIESDGKTDKSLDTDWIAPNAIYYLAKYVQYMERNYCKYNNNDYIFINPDNGKIYGQESIRHYFNYYIDKAELKRIKMKDLRHSCATFLLSIGYKLEDVKDKLRHTSINTTEKHYATFYNETRKNRAKDMNKYA